MKKLMAGIILIGAIMFSGITWAAGLKIGYADIASIFDQYSETKKSKLALEKEIKVKQDAIQKMSDELKGLRENLEAQQNTLSADDKKNKAQEIDRKAQELQKYTEESETQLARRESDITQNILNKIYVIVQQIGKEKGYTLILDKNNVIYGIDAWNVTSDVLTKLEDMSKGTTGPAPLSPPTTGYNQTTPVRPGSDNSPHRLNIKED